jgi:hypothetical protein
VYLVNKHNANTHPPHFEMSTHSPHLEWPPPSPHIDANTDTLGCAELAVYIGIKKETCRVEEWKPGCSHGHMDCRLDPTQSGAFGGPWGPGARHLARAAFSMVII